MLLTGIVSLAFLWMPPSLSRIAPEDKTRKVLYARVVIYLAATKWDMAAPVVRHLVKVDPGNLGAWINLARRAERIEQDIRRLALDGEDPQLVRKQASVQIP